MTAASRRSMIVSRKGVFTIAGTLLCLFVAATPVAAASPYISTLTQKVCTLDGGANGYGYTEGRAYIEEQGRSGTNYLVMIGRLQRLDGDQWVTTRTKPFSTASFANDSTTTYSTKKIRFNFDSSATSYYHRLSVRFEWWDERSGPDVLLAAKTRNGLVC
jgi:hypothetical protein